MVPLLGNFESMIEEVSKLRMFISCLSYVKRKCDKRAIQMVRLCLYLWL